MSGASVVSSVRSGGKPAGPRGPSIEIQLDSHYNTKIYNSGSPVSGEVVISPWRDVRFDMISIVLLGVSRTRMDAAQIAQHSSHTFLKLSMPIPESAYPLPRIFEAGQTYHIPFNFVIPQHLTLSACSHRKYSDDVLDQHMRLPPSVGHWTGLDDLSPDMARIDYMIKARVAEQPELGGRPIKLMETDCRINVLPSSIEDPPLSITSEDKGYTLTKSKNIRKNLFSGKQGRVTATTAQPTAIRISPDGRSATESSISVNLQFDPSSPETAPPKVTHVATKMQASTWFSSAPIANLPNMGDSRSTYATLPQLSYNTTVPLLSSDLGQAPWKTESAISRRDSGYSSEGHSQSESDNSNGRRKSNGDRKSPIFHQMQLNVPINLPIARKMFLPTFHSCLSSRTYTLQVSVHVGDSKLNLQVPLQIIVEPSAEQDLAGLPSFEAAMASQEEADVNELLTPRVMRQPAPELQQNSVLPGYGDLRFTQPAVAAA